MFLLVLIDVIFLVGIFFIILLSVLFKMLCVFLSVTYTDVPEIRVDIHFVFLLLRSIGGPLDCLLTSHCMLAVYSQHHLPPLQLLLLHYLFD